MIFFESEPAVAFGYGEASGRFEKDSSPPGNQHILPGNSSPSIDSAPSATCRVVALTERSLKLIGFFLLPIARRQEKT